LCVGGFCLAEPVAVPEDYKPQFVVLFSFGMMISFFLIAWYARHRLYSKPLMPSSGSELTDEENILLDKAECNSQSKKLAVGVN
jgi:hypothetical protein